MLRKEKWSYRILRGIQKEKKVPRDWKKVLWDHDTFGTNDFLGSVSLSVEDIKRCSKLDLPQRWALQGVKTGVVELRIKVIAEEPQAPSSSNSVASYKPAVTSAEADMGAKKPTDRESPLLCNKDDSPTCSDTSSPKLPRLIVSPHTSSPDEPFNKSSEYSSFRLMKQKRISVCNHSHLCDMYQQISVCNHSHLCDMYQQIAVCNHSHLGDIVPADICLQSQPLVCHVPADICLQSQPLVWRVPADICLQSQPLVWRVPAEGNSPGQPRVKRGLKLRRFRSEVSVSEDKRTLNGKPSAVSSVTMEPSGGGESDATELLQLDLSHAVSQPNILEASPSLRPRRPHELKVVSPARPDRYSGVEGRVVQAQGLHVAHVAQLYCRVKLHLGLSTSDKMGRSLAKSRFLPAVPNPQFDLPFQVDAPQSVPRQAALSFEVRSPGKEVLGSCRATLQELLAGNSFEQTLQELLAGIPFEQTLQELLAGTPFEQTLQELLAATSPDSNQVHTWLSLNNGASLEVMVAHGRELKKSGRKIFRSWSVHRIGKI
uniref:C2 domain-containing protein n=1 Tax=Timema douglasi TaxID=61478 RepID=A0A7R8VSK1_TIMDO|nr:unnamed protein product [Timema douglasi]